MSAKFRSNSVLLILAIELAVVTPAQTPGTAFTYQGRLDNAGSPATGPHDMRFRLWVSETDPNSPVGPVVCKDNVAVSDGLFSTQLDFGPNVYIGFPLWLGLEVRADATPGNCGSGTFTPLSPRQPLTPAPYAVWATTAGTAGLRLPYIVDANVAGPLFRLENSRTTGTTRTGDFLNRSTGDDSRAVSGLSSANSGVTYGVHGQSNSANGIGVYARSSGEAGIKADAVGTSGVNYGVYGESASTSGRGVFGLASETTGVNYGVFGQSASASGFAGYFVGARSHISGDLGIGTTTPRQQLSLGANLDLYSGGANSPTRPSIRGSSSDNLVLNASGAGAVYLNFDGGTGGVRFHDGTSGGEVMRIDNDGDVGIGTTAPSAKLHVFGNSGVRALDIVQGNSAGGCAQFAVLNAANSSDAVRGVHFGGGKGAYGQSNTGIGVHGEVTATSGINYGVYGNSASNNGRGVYGVAGFATAGNASYGVLGEEAPGPNFSTAVFAIGEVSSTGGKPFRIDHPDDPENKYLLHYAAESPEIINFYSGKVTLDNTGDALVTLPPYFAKINKDPRYLLTPVGAAMPNLHVAEEISEAALDDGVAAGPGEAAPRCSFRIAGGVAGAKVCWEVKALRNDLYVQNRGAPVEIEKQGLERGTYQHPEFYGQPPDKGMNFEARNHALRESAESGG